MVCFEEAGVLALIAVLQGLQGNGASPVGASIAVGYDEDQERVLGILNSDIGRVAPGLPLPGYPEIRVMAGPDWTDDRNANFELIPITMNGQAWFRLQAQEMDTGKPLVCMERPGIVGDM